MPWNLNINKNNRSNRFEIQHHTFNNKFWSESKTKKCRRNSPRFSEIKINSDNRCVHHLVIDSDFNILTSEQTFFHRITEYFASVQRLILTWKWVFNALQQGKHKRKEKAGKWMQPNRTTICVRENMRLT